MITSLNLSMATIYLLGNNCLVEVHAAVSTSSHTLSVKADFLACLSLESQSKCALSSFFVVPKDYPLVLSPPRSSQPFHLKMSLLKE